MRAPCRLLLAIVFLLTAGGIAAAQFRVTPTTTLTAETANNTSANSSFRAQTNGNAGAGNVSKLPIRNLLYPGSTTKIYAAIMPWFGRSDHMTVGYDSSDPGQINAQIADMTSRGIQGAIIPWYGPNSGVQSAMAVNFMQAAQARGNFEFAIMIDVGALQDYAQKNGCDVTTQLIQHLNYIASTFYGSTAYARVNGRPVIYFFGVEAFYIDWNKVRASIAGNPMFLVRNPGGFTALQSDGGYAWVEINPSDPNDIMLAYLDAFYFTAVQYPSAYAVGSAYKGFNDTLADWGANRIINQHCGQTWLDTFAELNRYYSSGNQLRAAQLVTWNDYEEGTEMESGIDNCVSMAAQVSGATLSWSTGGGNENTIDHYTVWISSDGQNLMKLAEVPAGAHALGLAQFGITAGTYILYVEAIGKPSIVNHMSPAVAFNPNDQAPIVQLTINPSSGPAPLFVSASSAGSSDPDGFIVSGRIDFGDGTVVNAVNATHTFVNRGTYTVTLTVTDNAGVFASTQKKVTVAAGPGVTISSPANGASVSTPVHVVATAVMANQVNSMLVQVDGSNAFSASGSQVDTYLKIASGNHTIAVISTDITGQTLSSSVNVNVSVADIPPQANLLVTLFGGGNQVMACTATSTDADGFIVSSSVEFGDGASGEGPTALHTYANAGTYTVTATVTDDAGVASTTTSQVTVGTSGACAPPSSPGVNICSPANGASVNSPITIKAAGRNTGSTAGIDVWLDGKKFGWYDGATSVNVQTNADPGSHQLDIYAVGTNGELQHQSVTFSVGGGSGGGGGSTSCPLPASPGVAICSPLPGANGGSPVHILAAGRDSVSTAGMDVWLDGSKLAWYGGTNLVDVMVEVSSGNHQLDIFAVGVNGELQKSSVLFSVGVGSTTCAQPGSPGVNICSPANGSTVGSPVRIYAAVRDSVTTAGIDVWLDGKKLGWFPHITTIDVQSAMGAGQHQLDIYAVGINGELQKGTTVFRVQ